MDKRIAPMDMKDMNTEVLEKWVDTLRSGKHTQTRGTLKGVDSKGNVSFCCLGVFAEEILGIDFGAVVFDDIIGDWDNEGCYVVYDVVKSKAPEMLCNTLAEYNDMGWTFEEIADHIEMALTNHKKGHKIEL